jgi:hypothetical protein
VAEGEIEVRIVKTDVIFLGAGASVSAGFPTNEGLTRYIIEELPFRKRVTSVPYDLPPPNFIESQWKRIARDLREANSLSVDEFCEIAQPTSGNGMELKRMLSLALFDKTAELKQWNDYVKFVYSLFRQGTPDLDDRFTIVNFNYDGLLGRMLVKAAQRRRMAANKGILAIEGLAALTGGWYGSDQLPGDDMLVRATNSFEPHRFCHHMPHGTFTVMRDSAGDLHSMEDVIYSEASHEAKENWFLKRYNRMPMIQFPWEKDSRLPVHQMQFEHAALSVEEAKRIHFIGLSGHSLLRHSLADIFSRVHPAMFQSKQWYIASPEDNQERVFRRLMDCFLPEELRRDEALKRQLLRPNYAKFYPTFEAWIKASPHLDA